MLTEERHTFILKKLHLEEIVKSQDLIHELQASESTIRRDLAILEEAGELIRVHGGAKRNYHLDPELGMKEKSFKNIQEKKQIAELAASLVQENDMIYLDAGSTTLELIPFLTQPQITVVTNGVQHASLLADANIHTLLVGGRLKNSTKAIVGTTSIAELSNYQFDKAFLGMNGVHPRFGFTTPDPEEAALKTVAIKQSFEPFILADKSKFDTVNFVKVSELEAATIVTHTLDKNVFQAYFQQTKIIEVRK